MRNLLRRFLPASLYEFLRKLKYEFSIRRKNDRQTIYVRKNSGETYLQKRFLSEMAGLDTRESYLRLVNNLDDESVQVVCRILARVQFMTNTSFSKMPLFNEEEGRQIKAMQKDFLQNIVQIDKECYAYQHYLFPVYSFEASVLYYHHQINLLETLDNVGEKAIIDVGGYIGDSALLFSHLFKGEIYSFEPIEANYQYLLKTIDMNKADRIIPVKLGLSDAPRTASFHVGASSSSEYALTPWSKGAETVELTTLDDFVAEHDLSVGLIKVDIEGAEQDFLKGAEKTIKTQKPVLIISIYHNAYDFFQIKPMIESWDLGYTFKISRPSDGQLLAETVLLAEVK